LNNLPLVSVIVTTYNRADLLCETIDSILYQTYKNFELIVVDDGSTDNTEEAVKMYSDSRLQYIKTDNWGGPARPRNIGINASKGKYISFCDDDDIWLHKKLEKQVIALDNSKYGMVFTMQKQFGTTSIFTNYYGITPLPFRVRTTPDALLNNNCIPLSSVLIKKKILDRIGVFNEDKTYIAIEDNDLWIRASKVKSIHFIPEVLVLHRVHKTNIYESTSDIEFGIKKMKETYTTIKVNRSKKINIKQTALYFFPRNLINFLYEKFIYRSIYGLK